MKKGSNLITGFTLVEVLVSVSIFTMVALVAIASVITANDLAKKTQNIRNAFDNLNFAIESMARSIRLGTVYTCPGAIDPNSCPGGNPSISFIDTNNTIIKYELKTDGSINSIVKTIGSNSFDITSGKLVKIDELKFAVFQDTISASPNKKQPRVTILIRGSVVNKPGLESKFSIQTSVSQRLLQQ